MTDKMKKTVELGKDVLILLLTCSALWLAGQSRLPAPVPNEPALLGSGQGQDGERAEMLRPLRIYANGVGAAGTGRCVVQSSTNENAFQQAVGMLTEALSSAAEPEQVVRRQWEDTLVEQPGLCFDFYGEIPMEVLAGEAASGSAVVRRLALTMQGNEVVLCYRDEESGDYFQREVQAVNPSQMEELLASMGDTGAFYAFESEWYEGLDPDTLLQSELPAPAVYAVANPVANGQSSLEELLTDLGFSLSTTSFYTSGDEVVARNGSDMLRLADRGTVHYEADSEGGGHFTVPSAWRSGQNLAQQVDLCRRIAASTIGERMGEARLYLSGIRETEEGTQISFDYSLDGLPVRFQEGFAALFIIQNGTVTRFDLRLRSYTDTGTDSLVLPPRQAAAALGALELEGRELTLVYSDSGSDKTAAGWAAIGRSTERE